MNLIICKYEKEGELMGKSKFETTRFYDMIEVKINDSHPHAYKPHLHSELAIGIIEKGDTVLTINEVDYEFGEGDAVIIMPYVVHNCQPKDIHNWSFTMIYLEDSFRDALADALSPDLKIGIAKLGQSEYNKIKNLTSILKSERDDFLKEVEIIDCINTIVDSIEVRISKEHDLVMERIRVYIEAHFLDSLSLDEIATEFDFNKFNLIRRFKRLYNVTPSAYQLQLKVNHAKHLLKSENNLVKVALEAGFYDQAHFSKEFKKATGMTPFQYIKAE
ncbi:AraC family transcriptional regulator [Fusibacter sp. 3D3]|uniref:AraC family transcriptional regulator n=1 Tax=Fusibacter sp. 3D3 TaxID=1048380 RepID=UPI0009FD6F49|nr:AraC family transcriptional regulator [Fusibacter sp. 3D3]